MKMQTYSAILRKDEGWWIGWVEEIPRVNSQGKTKPELLKNLRSALREAIELNREEALMDNTSLKNLLKRLINVRPAS